MTVAELINQLRECDPELEVYLEGDVSSYPVVEVTEYDSKYSSRKVMLR